MVECFSGIGQRIIARIQRRIQNPAKHLKWIFSQKYLNIFSRHLLLRKMPPKMFDRVLKTPVKFFYFVYIDQDQFVTVTFFHVARVVEIFKYDILSFSAPKPLFILNIDAQVQKNIFIDNNIYRKHFFIHFTMKIFF